MLKMFDDIIIYGFSFANDLSQIKMNEMHSSLSLRGVAWINVVFSAWEDLDSDCIWVVAANKYLKDNDIRFVIENILENNLEEEYLLTSFTTP